MTIGERRTEEKRGGPYIFRKAGESAHEGCWGIDL